MTMAVTHTPGPWHVGPHYKSDVESSQGRICECGITQGPQAEANANLIAAAPDLLAALKELASWGIFRREFPDGFKETVTAAIAKAEDHAAYTGQDVRTR